MFNMRNSSLSLASQNSRYHLAIGVALVSIIPILTFLYVKTNGSSESASPQFWHLTLYLLVLVSAFAGYALLRKLPMSLTKIRKNMETVVTDQFSQSVALDRTENDIVAIEKCMDLIVGELREKVSSLESEKHRLEQKLFQARKMESLGTMARGVSHDFNNLLAAVLGNINLVIRALPPDSPCVNNAKHVENTALRALDLTTHIQAYSGQCKLSLEQIDVSSLVRKTLKSSDIKPPSNIEITCNFAHKLPSIMGDTIQVQQLIKNLVTNAFDAISDNKGNISITTGTIKCDKEYLRKAYINDTFSDGDYVYIEVSDTGCGIAPKIYSRMFDPFFTTKIRGHGLGLSVVIGILRAHNGTIQIESQPENGATFRAVFPCNPEVRG